MTAHHVSIDASDFAEWSEAVVRELGRLLAGPLGSETSERIVDAVESVCRLIRATHLDARAAATDHVRVALQLPERASELLAALRAFDGNGDFVFQGHGEEDYRPCPAAVRSTDVQCSTSSESLTSTTAPPVLGEVDDAGVLWSAGRDLLTLVVVACIVLATCSIPEPVEGHLARVIGPRPEKVDALLKPEAFPFGGSVDAHDREDRSRPGEVGTARTANVGLEVAWMDGEASPARCRNGGRFLHQPRMTAASSVGSRH